MSQTRSNTARPSRRAWRQALREWAYACSHDQGSIGYEQPAGFTQLRQHYLRQTSVALQ